MFYFYKDPMSVCNLKDATDGQSLTTFDACISDTPQYSHFVVVAIDFGTTYSGYAYSFTHEPENVHVMRKWEGERDNILHLPISCETILLVFKAMILG